MLHTEHMLTYRWFYQALFPVPELCTLSLKLLHGQCMPRVDVAGPKPENHYHKTTIHIAKQIAFLIHPMHKNSNWTCVNAVAPPCFPVPSSSIMSAKVSFFKLCKNIFGEAMWFSGKSIKEDHLLKGSLYKI